MTRYIAGGGVILALLTFVGNEGWEKLQNAETHAQEAHQMAQNIDLRQRSLEKLVDKQEDYNRRLLKILEAERGIKPPTPTPNLNE